MKLTKQEYQNLIDSRLVDLEDAVKDYKDHAILAPPGALSLLIDNIIKKAEALKDAEEALNDAIEQEQIDEYEENKICGIDMAAGLDKALNIRKGE